MYINSWEIFWYKSLNCDQMLMHSCLYKKKWKAISHCRAYRDNVFKQLQICAKYTPCTTQFAFIYTVLAIIYLFLRKKSLPFIVLQTRLKLVAINCSNKCFLVFARAITLLVLFISFWCDVVRKNFNVPNCYNGCEI